MPRVAIFTEIPTPYRQPIFEKVLQRKEIEFDLLFLSLKQRDRPWEVDVRTSDRVRVLPGFQWCIAGHHTFYFNRGVRDLLSSRSYDALILGGYSQPALWAALRFSWRRKLPYVLWTESHHHKKRAAWLKGIKEPFLRKVYGRSKANLVAGSWAKDYVLSYGAPTNTVFSFPNSIDGPSFAIEVDEARRQRDQIRIDLGIKDGVMILFVGSLIQRKGVDLLVRACQTLEHNGVNAHLVCIGEGALPVQASSRIHLPGFVQPSDLPKWYAAADIFVLPSREEPYGAVLCEAMAAGLPLICSTAVGAGVDCITEGENGFIFPSGDAEKLLAALQRLAADPGLRKKIGAASRTRALRWTYDEFEKNLIRAAEAAL